MILWTTESSPVTGDSTSTFETVWLGANGCNETSSTTDNLSEGATNLYYTDARADTRATLRITAADIGNLNNVDETGVANNKILKYNRCNII